jgi:hypothetical protein
VHASVVDDRDSRARCLRHQAPSLPLSLATSSSLATTSTIKLPRNHTTTSYAQHTTFKTFKMAGFGPHNPPGAPRPSPAAQWLV